MAFTPSRRILGDARRGSALAHSPCAMMSPAPSSRGSLGPDEFASMGLHGRNDMSIMSRASFSSRAGNDRARRTTGHGHSRDPRPLGDRGYTQQCAKMVEEFLESRGYPLDVTRRLQSSNVISSREYYDIFKYLANLRDETMKLEGSMDVEIPCAMKKWKFPFELKKSKLQNIGAPGSWPELIAILAWVVEFIEADEPKNALGFDGFADLGEDEFCEENSSSAQDAVPTLEKQAAYVEFLHGKDREEIQAGWLQKIASELEDLEEAIADAERRFHEKEEELTALDKRHDEVPLLEEQRQRHVVATEALDHEIRSVAVKTQGVQERMQQLETEAQTLEAENAAHEAEVSELRSQVQQQPMTIAEVEHMKLEWNRKRDADSTLKKDVERLDVQIRELAGQETAMEDELRRIVQMFNELLWAAKIGQPEDKRAEGLDLSLRPDFSGPVEALLSIDWSRARRHLAKVTQHLDEKGRQSERETQESQIEQKRTSERISETERSNEKRRRQVEQQRRNNQELRERHSRELAALGQKAANMEDQLYSVKCSSPIKPLDDSEIDNLQKQLASVKRWAQEESQTIAVQMQKDVKTACNLQFTAKRELMETLNSMKNMERDLLGRMALQPVSPLGGA